MNTLSVLAETFVFKTKPLPRPGYRSSAMRLKLSEKIQTVKENDIVIKGSLNGINMLSQGRRL